eukprot:g5156.t1
MGVGSLQEFSDKLKVTMPAMHQRVCQRLGVKLKKVEPVSPEDEARYIDTILRTGEEPEPRDGGTHPDSSGGADLAAFARLGIKVHPGRVDFHAGEAVLHASLFDVCRALVDGWAGVRDAQCSVRQISGGITNMLYRVTARREGEDPPMGAADAALVRVYGDKTELMIDRLKDTTVFAELAALKFGPPFHGAFGNGRVEGWCEMRPLDAAEIRLRCFAAPIARTMGRMHRLLPSSGGARDRPVLWTVLNKWLGMVAEIEFAYDEGKRADLARLDPGRLRAELAWLKTRLPTGSGSGHEAGRGPARDNMRAAMRACAWKYASEIVFTHHDVLGGNVLTSAPPPPTAGDSAGEPADGPAGSRAPQTMFIDFEYGGYDYRGFDIANHFCEYAGFDADFERWYPAERDQLAFFRDYVEAAGYPVEATRAGTAFDFETFAVELHAIVCRFALASHFLWGLWGIIQARHSPIDFDFMGYARDRFKGYYFHKGLWAADLFGDVFSGHGRDVAIAAHVRVNTLHVKSDSRYAEDETKRARQLCTFLEWVAYHMAMGIEHVYVHSFNDHFFHASSEVQQLVIDGHVTLMPFDVAAYDPFTGCRQRFQGIEKLPQDEVLHRFSARFQWALMCDIDEFVVIKSQSRSLRRFLAKHGQTAAKPSVIQMLTRDAVLGGHWDAARGEKFSPAFPERGVKS